MQLISARKVLQVIASMKTSSAVLVFGLFALTVAYPETDERYKNCFIKYFKSIDKLRSDYPTAGSGQVIDDCDQFVDTGYVSFAETSSLKLQKFGLCYESEQKTHDLHAALSIARLNAMTRDEFSLTPKEIEDGRETYLSTLIASVMPCSTEGAQKVYKSMTKIYSEFVAGKDEEQFCLKQHVVDQRLIDTSVYEFDINPKELDPIAIDCKKIQADLIKAMNYPQIDTKEFNLEICSRFINFQPKMVELYFTQFVFNSIDLTSEQKETERAQFYTNMVPYIKYFYICSTQAAFN